MSPRHITWTILAALAGDPALAQSVRKPPAKPVQNVCLASRPPRAHNLFLMFLTAPPPAGDKADWTLQSAVSQQYASCEACLQAAKSIVAMIARVPTINVSGSCLPVGGAPDVELTTDSLPSEKAISGRELPVLPPIDFNALRNSLGR